MKDLTDYIVEKDGKFLVDNTDINTPDFVFTVNEPFIFNHHGTNHYGKVTPENNMQDSLPDGVSEVTEITSVSL